MLLADPRPRHRFLLFELFYFSQLTHHRVELKIEDASRQCVRKPGHLVQIRIILAVCSAVSNKNMDSGAALSFKVFAMLQLRLSRSSLANLVDALRRNLYV